MIGHGTNNAAHSRVRANDRGLRMALQHRFHLREGNRLSAGFGKWHIHVVVDKNEEPSFCGKVQDQIKGWVLKRGGFPCYFCGAEFLVNAELTNGRENAWEREKDATNVIDTIHVSRIEPCNHGIEPSLLLFRQRPVRHG